MADIAVDPQVGAQLAALDLGSNSFHLIVAQDQSDRIQVIDKLKEMVRLADGLDADNNLTESAMQRALECLERFGQRVRSLGTGNVRIVGTNTLRKARNASQFIARAEAALGHQIEIISGREEARLIYLGVSQALADNFDQRLVVDIGGGSTELILGRQFEPQLAESLYIGCVSTAIRYFPDNRITPKAFDAAVTAALRELEPVRRTYIEHGWDTAIGASGTIVATHTILQQIDPLTEYITPDGLIEIRDRLFAFETTDEVTLPGLGSNRAPVYPAGLAVLQALFRGLGIDRMQISDGALREGLLHDLLGRVHRHDVREQTVAALISRFHIDDRHTRRVRETARVLLAQIANDWNLTSPNCALLLSWAADLHELGMDVSHTQYHKHGEYLLQNMDMPGFSRYEQSQLASLVRCHRRKLPLDLPALQDQTLLRLAAILRIAVILHRGRSTDPLPHVTAMVSGSGLTLTFPEDWFARHPLTRLDLEQEAELMASMSIELAVTLVD